MCVKRSRRMSVSMRILGVYVQTLITTSRGYIEAMSHISLLHIINAISRAGLSSTLAYVISDNESPRLPDWALKRRDDICTEAFIRSKRVGNLVFCNMTGVEDAWRYAGLVASKIANETNFPTIVFTQSESGLVSGSFRKGIGEGEFLETAKKYLNANGHNPAFGFKDSTKEGLKNFIAEISTWEVGEPPEQLTSDDIKGWRRPAELWVFGITVLIRLMKSISRCVLMSLCMRGRQERYPIINGVNASS